MIVKNNKSVGPYIRLNNLVRSEIQIFQYIDTKYYDFVTQIDFR